MRRSGGLITATVFAAALTLGTPLPFPAGALPPSDSLTFQERQCVARGWRPITLDVEGLSRRVLWKGPEGPWAMGSIMVLHGGGGHHFQFCVANAPTVEAQVRFTERALTKGFAVFLLESSDRVTDGEGRSCGKVWDDEVRDRPNIDLPFVDEVISSIIPRLRPPGSRNEVFLAGLSSGGYMATRSATHFGDRIAAFAPVSSGDPYGWHRVCEKSLTARSTVHGAGFDNETGRQITEPDACRAEVYVKEKPWDGASLTRKPTFRMFYHRKDGVNDRSCAEKAAVHLREHGYPEAPAFQLDGGRQRSLWNHLWQDDYNDPILEFFISRLDTRK